MSAKVSNKYYVEAFFRPVNETKYHCDLCPPGSSLITQKKGSGYTNLINHLDAKHENFKLIYQQQIENTSTTNSDIFNYSASMLNIFNWVSLIVKCQLPLNICENPDFISHTSLLKLDSSMVSKYLNGLADIV